MVLGYGYSRAKANRMPLIQYHYGIPFQVERSAFQLLVVICLSISLENFVTPYAAKSLYFEVGRAGMNMTAEGVILDVSSKK